MGENVSIFGVTLNEVSGKIFSIAVIEIIHPSEILLQAFLPCQLKRKILPFWAVFRANFKFAKIDFCSIVANDASTEYCNKSTDPATSGPASDHCPTTGGARRPAISTAAQDDSDSTPGLRLRYTASPATTQTEHCECGHDTSQWCTADTETHHGYNSLHNSWHLQTNTDEHRGWWDAAVSAEFLAGFAVHFHINYSRIETECVHDSNHTGCNWVQYDTHKNSSEYFTEHIANEAR